MFCFISMDHRLSLLYCVCAKSLQSRLTVCDPVDVAGQSPLAIRFSRREYWSGLPIPSPGDLPYLGIESRSLNNPALAGWFFTTSPTWEVVQFFNDWLYYIQGECSCTFFLIFFPLLMLYSLAHSIEHTTK